MSNCEDEQQGYILRNAMHHEPSNRKKSQFYMDSPLYVLWGINGLGSLNYSSGGEDGLGPLVY